MTAVKIKERETEEYAMSLPTLIKVRIKDGKILEDNRQKFYTNYYIVNEGGRK